MPGRTIGAMHAADTAMRPPPPRGFKYKSVPTFDGIHQQRSLDDAPSPAQQHSYANGSSTHRRKSEERTLSETVDWVADGWAAAPGVVRSRKSVLPPSKAKKRKSKAATFKQPTSSSAATQPSAPMPAHTSDAASSFAPPWVVAPPAAVPADTAIGTTAARAAMAAGRSTYEVPRVRELHPDDPRAWVADGWSAVPGTKRESRQIQQFEPKPKRREVDAASLAAQAAITAQLVVGARVEARYLASHGAALGKVPTFFFPGTIEAVHPDGTYSVRYDDGDFEESVKRRFVRLHPSSRSKRGAASAAPEAATTSGSPGAVGAVGVAGVADADAAPDDDEYTGEQAAQVLEEDEDQVEDFFDPDLFGQGYY